MLYWPYPFLGGFAVTEYQNNRLRAIMDGIELARSELSGPGAQAAMRQALDQYFLREDDAYQPMGLGVTAYIACCLIAWKDWGFPPLGPEESQTSGPA